MSVPLTHTLTVRDSPTMDKYTDTVALHPTHAAAARPYQGMIFLRSLPVPQSLVIHVRTGPPEITLDEIYLGTPLMARLQVQVGGQVFMAFSFEGRCELETISGDQGMDVGDTAVTRASAGSVDGSVGVVKQQRGVPYYYQTEGYAEEIAAAAARAGPSGSKTAGGVAVADGSKGAGPGRSNSAAPVAVAVAGGSKDTDTVMHDAGDESGSSDSSGGVPIVKPSKPEPKVDPDGEEEEDEQEDPSTYTDYRAIWARRRPDEDSDSDSDEGW